MHDNFTQLGVYSLQYCRGHACARRFCELLFKDDDARRASVFSQVLQDRISN